MKKFTLFFILIFSFQVLAQEKFGSIKGIVTDINGAVFPNVKVKVISVIGGRLFKEKVLLATTDSKGEFVFREVPIGLYEVQLKADWTEIIVKKRVRVIAESESQIDRGFLTYVIEACSDVLETKDLTTETDKREIVREILKTARTYNKTYPILSTKNIKAAWLEDKDRQQFKLMKQAAIQYQADTKADFEYYKFSLFRVKGACVEVSFDYIWAVGKNSQMIYLSGEGTTYEFRKVDGKWIKRRVTSWVS